MTHTVQSIEKILQNSPNCHLSVNLKKHSIDHHNMGSEHPILLDMFARCMDGEDDAKHTQMWLNFKRAYMELESEGFYNEPFEKDYQKVINTFKAKVEGPNLIPAKSLKDILTKKTRKGVVSYQLEYTDFADMIENYYDISTRGFFSTYLRDNKEAIYHRYLKLSDDEYQKIQRLSPMESVEAAKLRLMSDAFGDELYVDFWHHMLDADFSEISNGSVATMWASENEASDDIEEQIFYLIRKVFFKEVTSLPVFKGVEEIEFSISW